jgi:hypothetical protein
VNGRTFIAVLILCAVIALRERYRKYQAAKEDEQTELFDSARLQGEIYALYHAAQELERLDTMLIDLRLCKPSELHRNFRISWDSATGSHDLDFMSDGQNANTANLIAIATDQREAVNEDIQQRIIDLYSKAQSLDFMTVYSSERNAQSSAQSAEGEC